MQSSVWAVLSELFMRLLAVLFGVTSEPPPPITFELPAVDAIEGGVAACAQGEFGLSRGEGARDVACLAAGGFVSVMTTDGDDAKRVSNTGLHFERFERAPAVADVDGDGRLDLAVLARTSEVIADWRAPPCEFAVLLGDGAGGFSLGPSRRLPHQCLALGSADFDEDGAPDFVLPYGEPESRTALGATLLLNRPGGQFEIRQYREQPTSRPPEDEYFERPHIASDAVVFDADGDQHADILFVVVALGADSRSVALHALLGDGQGGFRDRITQRLGMWGWKFSITAADYDEDGFTDVVVAALRETYTDGDVELPRLLLGQGDGAFGEPIAVPPTEASADLHSADYDGDGHVDLVTSGVQGPVHLYAGHGDGSFARPIGLSVGREPYWISTLDYGLDGVLDLVALTANGLERIPLPPREARPGAPRVYSFVLQNFMDSADLSTRVIDFDGDSDHDVVRGTSTGLVVFSNEGPDGFRVLDIELLARDESPHAHEFALGDLNGDGLVDVMQAVTPDLRVHLQRADGTWEPLPPIPSENGSWQPLEIAFADADGDGRLDIVETGNAGPQSALWIHLQDPAGEFTRLLEFKFDGEVVAFRDLDANGCFDVLLHVWDYFGVMIGDCSGKFALEHFVAGPPSSWSLEFADMNLDGRNDFISRSGILLANASGGYEQAATLPGDADSSVWVLELNGDGIPDVALASEEIVTLIGDGEGGMSAVQRVISGLPQYYSEVTFGDLVGDELPDAVVTSFYGPFAHDDPPHAPYRGPPGNLVELTVLENVSAR